jgi:hypothetical protein
VESSCGFGVHADAAVFLDDLRVEVRDDVGVGLFDGLIDGGLQGFQLFGIGPADLVTLGVELIVGAFDLRQGGFFGDGQLVVPMVSVPLNAMCSNMWARPVLPLGSSTEPALT